MVAVRGLIATSRGMTFPDSLDDVPTRLWQRLGRAAADKNDAMRWPVVATAGPDGAPRTRVVVLRDCDRDLRRLTFYTDARSAKVSELGIATGIAMLFFDPRRMEQIRVRGGATVLTEGDRRDGLLAAIPDDRRGDYSAPAPPGRAIDGPDDGQHDQSHGEHFSVVDIVVTAADWLCLKDGQRRVQVDITQEGAPVCRWVMP